MWADAMCINQNDNEERSQQVMLMQTIFNNAIGVHAWLGVTSSDSDQAMDFVKDWSRKASSEAPTPKFLEWVSRPNQPWAALAALVERPW